jgi:hypothetical protein
MKDASFVQVRQVGHVFNFLELGWVHLAKHILLHSLILLTHIMIRQTVLMNIVLLGTQLQLFISRKWDENFANKSI